VEHITIKSPDLSSLSCSASTKLKSAEWKRKYGVWLWTAADSSPYRRFLRGNALHLIPLRDRAFKPPVEASCRDSRTDPNSQFSTVCQIPEHSLQGLVFFCVWV